MITYIVIHISIYKEITGKFNKGVCAKDPRLLATTSLVFELRG